MPYARFLAYSVLGTLLWVSSFVLAGYFFGTIPVIKRNLTLIILVIIVISVTPGIIHYWQRRRRA
jgi:membrane-associated protein